jgi:hypothetical protein
MGTILQNIGEDLLYIYIYRHTHLSINSYQKKGRDCCLLGSHINIYII